MHLLASTAPLVPTWWYVTALLLAAVILGLAKSGFGGGVGILAVPLTANVLPADKAVAVLLPMLIVGDVLAAVAHWRTVSWKTVWPMLGGAVVGIGIGTLVFLWLDDIASLTKALNLTVGGICLVMVAIQAWRLAGGTLPHVPPTPPAGIATGAVSGVISTLAHASGPVAAVYLLEIKLEKAAFVATAAWFFLLVNVLKLPTYFGLGLIDAGTLAQSAWFAAAIPLGTLLGLWALRRIPEKPFTAVIYVATAVAAARMIWVSVA